MVLVQARGLARRIESEDVFLFAALLAIAYTAFWSFESLTRDAAA
jgi:hypothetical protein